MSRVIQRKTPTSVLIAECFSLITTVYCVAYMIYSIEWLNKITFCGEAGVLLSYMTGRWLLVPWRKLFFLKK